MEHLLVVASELGGSLGPEFYDTFQGMGCACLPRSVFRQHIDRGVIVVTESLVYHLLFNDVHVTDPELFFAVLCHLPEERAWHVLRSSKKPLPLYLVQHFATRNPWLFARSARPELTPCDGSPLIPLTLLVGATAKALPPRNACTVPSDPHTFEDLRKRVCDFDLMYTAIRFPSCRPRAAAAASSASTTTTVEAAAVATEEQEQEAPPPA